MATYTWTIPTGNIINGSTYIKDTDNKIQDTMDDLADFVNSSGAYTGQGLMFDYVNKANNQTITGVKTFSNGIISNVTGNVTGTVSGNSGTATKLATARTITLAGDVSGSASFDGSANISINATVGDDSHYHSISTVSGLQSALDGKLSTSGNATTATKLATARTISLTGDATGSVSFDGSANANITTTVNYATYSSNATNANYANSAGTASNANLVGGFTPIQQGGGTHQGTSKIYIGWSNTGNGKLNLQIDSTAFGANWPINSDYANSAGTANSATSITYNAAAYGAAQLSTGDIGTYAMLTYPANNVTIDAGVLVAGSNLRYSGISNSSGSGSYAYTGSYGNAPAGTWRAMGYCLARSDRMPSTLFLRIS